MPTRCNQTRWAYTTSRVECAKIAILSSFICFASVNIPGYDRSIISRISSFLGCSIRHSYSFDGCITTFSLLGLSISSVRVMYPAHCKMFRAPCVSEYDNRHTWQNSSNLNGYTAPSPDPSPIT